MNDLYHMKNRHRGDIIVAMTIRGTVQSDGSIVLDKSAKLASGTAVSVQPVGSRGRATAARKGKPTLYDQIAPFIGKARSLPRDMADQHDHYLYGTPRRR